MKPIKKVIAVLTTLALAVLMCVPGVSAFAANTNSHTITITNDKSGHEYTAYQVFKGDISDGKLTNIEWGSGVDGVAVLAKLKELDDYKDCTTAEAVADVLAGFKSDDDSTRIDAFAKVVGAHLITAAGSSTETEGNTSSTYTINVTGDGYYFVKDTGTLGENDAATKYILKVLGDVTVKAKAETPDIDKVIVNADSANGSEGKGTAQDVGSKVDFKVTSKVPKMDGYDTYTYVINDTMTAGLTPVDENNDGKIDVAVTIDGTSYTNFTVEQTGQNFIITFNNFISQKAKAGKDIVVTYSAIINENALITNVETNTVNLDYSNNPNDNTSKGKTPDKVVYVYDFDIVVDKWAKTDSSENQKLAGAKFVLFKTVDSKNMYYYYDASTKKVEWVELADDAAVTAAITAGQITQVTTDASGAAKFQGLDTGTYYLHETEAPAGYNLLKNDVTVTITATYGADGQITSSSATSTNNGQYQQTQPIENKSGSLLPETGGMGTTIFYIIGALLVLGAGITLVVRRRSSDK